MDKNIGDALQTILNRLIAQFGEKTLIVNDFTNSSENDKEILDVTKEVIYSFGRQLKVRDLDDFYKEVVRLNSEQFDNFIKNLKLERRILVRFIRSLSKSAEWRKAIYKRDNYTCQKCEGKDNLEAHHIKSFKEILIDNKIKTISDALNCEELWDLNNGITLCQKCHSLTDSYRGKNICLKK